MENLDLKKGKKKKKRPKPSNSEPKPPPNPFFEPTPYVPEYRSSRPLSTPKYLPDVDGKPWKVWGYPELEQFPEDYLVPPPEIDLPDHVKIDGYDLRGLRPSDFGITHITYQVTTGVLIFMYAVRMIGAYYHLIRHLLKGEEKEKMPGAETSSSGED